MAPDVERQASSANNAQASHTDRTQVSDAQSSDIHEIQPSDTRGKALARLGPIPPSTFYSQPKSCPERTPPRLSHVSAPRIQSTPLEKKTASSHAYESTVQDKQEMYNQLSQEMRGKFLGCMPPQLFLNRFLPLETACEDSPKNGLKGCFDGVVSASTEIGMYKPLMRALKPYIKDMAFRDTHVHPDTERDNLAPDVSLYHTNNLPTQAKPTNFAKMSTFVELKKDANADPFKDLTPKSTAPFERIEDASKANRCQIASYSAAISGTQFRVHVFSVSICGKNARFIRWDRTGAVVTRSFDYTKNPQLLISFFWRYSRLSYDQQGYDTSISAASEEDVKILDESGSKQRLKDANPAHSEFRKMMVPDRDDPSKEKPFLISYPPVYDARSPFARATRVMLAFDLTAKRLVFLKDYWRADVPGMEKEGDIYGILEAHKVRHIAPFGTGNDVRDHKTLTDAMKDLSWASPTRGLICLCHYRMTLNVIGQVLTKFNSSYQLVSAIADAMQAHDDAAFEAKILHRDISAGNILINTEDDDEHGMLIDWDLSAKIQDDGDQSVARRPGRTGTWQFMSVNLLQNPSAPHGIQDDRESAFYVLLWIALRYSKHKKHANFSFQQFLKMFDEQDMDDSGRVTLGGQRKSNALKDYAKTGLKFSERPELDDLLAELATTFAIRYRNAPSEDDKMLLDAIEIQLKSENANIPFLKKMRRSNREFQHRNLTEKLAKQGWLVKTIRHFLDEEGGWPLGDKAEFQDIVSADNKRKADRDLEDLKTRPAKKSHLSHCE